MKKTLAFLFTTTAFFTGSASDAEWRFEAANLELVRLGEAESLDAALVPACAVIQALHAFEADCSDDVGMFIAYRHFVIRAAKTMPTLLQKFACLEPAANTNAAAVFLGVILTVHAYACLLPEQQHAIALYHALTQYGRGYFLTFLTSPEVMGWQSFIIGGFAGSFAEHEERFRAVCTKPLVAFSTERCEEHVRTLLAMHTDFIVSLGIPEAFFAVLHVISIAAAKGKFVRQPTYIAHGQQACVCLMKMVRNLWDRMPAAASEVCAESFKEMALCLKSAFDALGQGVPMVSIDKQYSFCKAACVFDERFAAICAAIEEEERVRALELAAEFPHLAAVFSRDEDSVSSHSSDESSAEDSSGEASDSERPHDHRSRKRCRSGNWKGGV